MKIAVNVALSLIMLALCVWLVWPGPDQQRDIEAAFRAIELAEFWPYLAGCLALLAAAHFCRAWRWNNLLQPIGVRLEPGPLLAISSVGFMAILALPARLGEFVRPALIRRKGEISAAAALGTVVVERVVDGLIVSLFAAGALLALSVSPRWLWVALAVFAAALFFLTFALRAPEATVRVAVRVSLLRHVSPRLALAAEDKLRSLIRGFLVLEDRANLARFVAWTVAYWGANGLSLWVLARGFGLELSVVGAFTTMGLIAIGITLPNAPFLLAQYHVAAQIGLTLYVGSEIAGGQGLAFAIVLHGIQVIWYLGVGTIALASPYVSFAEVLASRRPAGPR